MTTITLNTRALKEAATWLEPGLIYDTAEAQYLSHLEAGCRSAGCDVVVDTQSDSPSTYCVSGDGADAAHAFMASDEADFWRWLERRKQAA